MTNIFLTLFNMSITASYCIVFVCIIRLFLKRVPKIFSYVLWLVVAFRLICPISLESPFSLVGEQFVPDTSLLEKAMPGNHENSITEEFSDVEKKEPSKKELSFDMQISLKENDALQKISTKNASLLEHENAEKEMGTSMPSANIDKSHENANVEKNTTSMLLLVLTCIWFLVVLLLVGYSIFTYLHLKHRLRHSAQMKGYYHTTQIYEVAGLDTPFVLGLIKPNIYLPTGLNQEEQNQCLAHEHTHIRRKDYLIKQAAFLLVCVYWFQPLVWLAFHLMTKDMEMSCDEAALKSPCLEDRKAYSDTLLSLASANRHFAGCPLAFGGSNTSSRIKNIMKFKRPGYCVLAAMATLVLICILGLSTNPVTAKGDGEEKLNTEIQTESKAIQSAKAYLERLKVTENAGSSKETVSYTIQEHTHNYPPELTIKLYYNYLLSGNEIYLQKLDAVRDLENELSLAKELELSEKRITQVQQMLEYKEEQLSDCRVNAWYGFTDLILAQSDLNSELHISSEENSADYRLFATVSLPEDNDWLALRDQPNAEGKLLGTLSDGSFVEVLDYIISPDKEASDYAYISYYVGNGAYSKAYVCADFLMLNDTPGNTYRTYCYWIGKLWADGFVNGDGDLLYNMAVDKDTFPEWEYTGASTADETQVSYQFCLPDKQTDKLEVTYFANTDPSVTALRQVLKVKAGDNIIKLPDLLNSTIVLEAEANADK